MPCEFAEGGVSKSALEAELALQIRALGLPEPVREYQAITGRTNGI